MLNGKNIVIGVCGGIAAYKSLEVISRLKKLGANVDVIMTKSATNFVSPLSFESLSQNAVTVSMFDNIRPYEIEHIALAKKADLFCIVPATANIIGKVANGIADDMVSTTIMATKSTVVFAPAMNTAMYENTITQQNIKKLKDLGYYFIEPDCGRLACGDTGRGKLADVDTIVDEICFYLYDKKDFGIIKDITDKDYYTNSNHVPVWYKCSISHKARVEGPYHALSLAGNIFYVEIDSDATHNPESIATVVDMMDKYNMGYCSVNHNRNRCLDCGYEDAARELKFCPHCGGSHIDTLQRIIISCISYEYA